MRLAMYAENGRPGLAAAEGEVFHGLLTGEADFPGDLDSLLAEGRDLAAVGKALQSAPVIDLEKISFLPPLMRPGKIICVGMNYAAHSAEFGRQVPVSPELFSRFTTTLIGHREPLIKPAVSEQLDFEGELVAVIGRDGRNITREKALEHVAAYSIFNDGSVRDYQFRGLQWLPGKNFDNTGAFGPWLVTAEALPAGAKGLALTTRLNGEVMQNANTDDLIFDIPALIESISEIMTLKRGDVLVTGTPGGVGQGRDPKVFMKSGDVCEITIEGIGTLSNPVN
ncbi:fumarylacetoacetate hydrolase [Deltaproteobacteria bacterium Smac51]|nr:fumarylacetoacetate hydrolase [Deltaproteobacteria bacterium Smac51]